MPGKLNLLFVRHGETQDNIDKVLQGWRDTDLTENGHNDAQTVAGKVKGQPIDAVYHSPLKRIKQTIAPILKDHPDAPTTEDPDLRGQGMGELEGGSYDLVDMSNPRSANGKPGVELFDDFLRRLLRAMARIVGTQAPKVGGGGGGERTVVVATHGVCITSIFKCLEGTPQCEGFFSHELASRGPEAYEVRYPDSTDVAKLVVEDVAGLPIKDGVLDWEGIKGTPFVIERWGRKESKLAADYYSK
ncbi:phosphoglycerate mutase [Neohortaea acidophila]|uniref:Phosphoglycerate mutase n=1 Tax=Neohortaea acidophila TaxID=245834 RepID=A0A6A6Q7T7_9PEZI|nr:phosphoglycerate mutase [Neohortaea acidophila]KAF2488131.1 phosphoglycerate mutase [Neohortaea acidophila]